MKRIIYIVILLVVLLYSLRASDTVVSDTFGNLTKKIIIQAGIDNSVWTDYSRSLITGGVAEMTPAGDGTWEYTVNLDQGEFYNYMFFAATGDTAPQGLSDNTTYYDAVLTSGSIQAGTSPYEANLSSACYYYAVGDDKDARRVLHMPKNLTIGQDTVYIFNNFGGSPQALPNFSAMPNDGNSVKLTWDDPINNWGASSESFKAVDVIAGGTITLLRSTSPTDSFIPIDDIDGSNNTYIDTALTTGTTYYYLAYVGDAYLGSSSETFAKGVYSADTTETVTAVPKVPIKVIFIIQRPDWDYINANNRIVYATPYSNRHNPFAKKVKCSISRVYLKKRG